MSATDRINDLPDDLLLHVMFFLTLQEAVQTCLLSRRWKNVWASLMWLNFDAAKFSSMKAFKKFVDNLLQYRNSLPAPVPLDAFWISAVCNHSNDSLDYSDIHPWIRHALDSNAWALGIPEHRGPRPLSIEGYPFPFTSVHLTLLGLCHFKVVPKVLQRDLPRCVTFSSLKRLHLGEWFLSRGCYPLIYLLQRSPEMQKLILQLDKSGAEDYGNRVAFLPVRKHNQHLVVKSLEKLESTAPQVMKEHKSSCASYLPTLVLSLVSKSSQF